MCRSRTCQRRPLTVCLEPYCLPRPTPLPPARPPPPRGTHWQRYGPAWLLVIATPLVCADMTRHCLQVGGHVLWEGKGCVWRGRGGTGQQSTWYVGVTGL